MGMPRRALPGFGGVPLLLVLIGCAHVPRRNAAMRGGAPPPRVSTVDLSPRFLAFYDSASARPMDADARFALWKRLDGFAAVPPTPFGDTLARRLLDGAWDRYRDSLPRIRRGIAALGVSPDDALRSVVALLGCGRDTRVRVTVFVGGFEDNAFAYSSADGVPTVAVPLEVGDAERSLLHEFTHAVHRGPGCADMKSGYGQSLAELVISEGLAMRVVQRLRPGHAPAYYVQATQGWLDSANASRRAILDGVREHLSDSGAATAQRFTFGAGTTGLRREGYYVGWEVVGALERAGVTLHDMATTRPPAIPALVSRGIDLAERR